MNPNVEPPPPPALAQPPQLPQPHRQSTSCDRHPEEHFASFFPLCLCERLHVLDSSSTSSAASSFSRKPPIAATTSTATTALKAIFKPSGGGGNRPGARNTLWSLFHHDAERNPHKKEEAGNGRSSENFEAEPPNLASFSSVVQGPVFESNEGRQIENETKTFLRMPTMVSVVEDAPVHNFMRRRKSLDRSSSIWKTAAAVVAETGEIKSVSKAKVSPARGDYFNVPKIVVPDRDSNSNSLRDDYSETFERSVNKDEGEGRYNRANDVERSYSESWLELRGERNRDARGGFNPKIMRSNSSISWRSSRSFGARYMSARYSPNNIDNGLLRLYLTRMRGSRRCGSSKSSASHAHFIVRSLLRLY
ncbi:hypothetical protein F3Y22_tig00110931pilonHSYRG00015 [Hibiscus syriacus]|uniref:Uncharacterized protein n=1 Tax=Hibiscus syriacus TaxID=106335 RepID=A0A6A2ZDZ1_HIBSY|nr:hypothetical protein F3Y22_tig00110931pilonHSYRG00015 [Hibiscus syriacus]